MTKRKILNPKEKGRKEPENSPSLVLSPSSIQAYIKCPLIFLFRYGLGMVLPPSSGLTYGRCFHSSLEHNYRNKKNKGKDSKLSVVQDVFHENFKTLRGETVWKEGENPDKIEKDGIDLVLPFYMREVAPPIFPDLIEESFKIDLPEFGVSLNGRMDLIDVKKVIIDHKSGKRAPTAGESRRNLQMPMYALGYRKKFKKKEKGVRLDYILKRSSPDLVPVYLKEDRVWWAERTIKEVVRAIKAGIFFPRPLNNFMCTPRACGYWNLCTKGVWKAKPIHRIIKRNEIEEEVED